MANQFVHPRFDEADALSRLVIGAAIDVHRDKGPGLLESIYEWCLTMELQERGLRVISQKAVEVRYKQFRREYPLKFDLLVNDCLLIEVKAVEAIKPIHKAQLLSYMKLLDVSIGFLLNFNSLKLTDGLSRLILPQKPLR